MFISPPSLFWSFASNRRLYSKNRQRRTRLRRSCMRPGAFQAGWFARAGLSSAVLSAIYRLLQSQASRERYIRLQGQGKRGKNIASDSRLTSVSSVLVVFRSRRSRAMSAITAMGAFRTPTPLNLHFVANKRHSAFNRPVIGRSSVGHRTVTGRFQLGRSRSFRKRPALADC